MGEWNNMVKKKTVKKKVAKQKVKQMIDPLKVIIAMKTFFDKLQEAFKLIKQNARDYRSLDDRLEELDGRVSDLENINVDDRLDTLKVNLKKHFNEIEK